MPAASVWAAEGTCACETGGASGGAAEVTTVGGGKASQKHARARATKAEADKAAELRAAKRAEENARKIAAGEKPLAETPVVTGPIKVPTPGGGKAARAHARAKATKAAADQAAAQNAE